MKHEEVKISGSRKESHLNLAFESQNSGMDERFHYEPMLSAHPEKSSIPVFLGNQKMDYPLWISSMTGGTSEAADINKVLAKTARKFGLGIGLGSCRIILDDQSRFEDFNLRPILGDEVPFYANLGIAQVEELLGSGKIHLLKKMLSRLQANGLIIHVNPLQEWLQPEGDRFQQAPLETVKQLLNEISHPVIVKEVGQGFGPASMKELLRLPILAVDFAANGGTNFSKLELLRNPDADSSFASLISVGHTAEEMVNFLNEAAEELGNERKCEMAIISGGIKSFLDGYYLMSKCHLPSIYGQASAFLRHAKSSQEELDKYVQSQINGLLLSRSFLKIKNN